MYSVNGQAHVQSGLGRCAVTGFTDTVLTARVVRMVRSSIFSDIIIDARPQRGS